MAKKGPHNKGSGDGSPVDLGLSALLAEKSSSEVGERVRAGPQSEQEDSSQVASRSAGSKATKPEVLSEFETLARAGDWEQLASVCEQGLAPQLEANSFAHLERRVWWIRSQQKKEAVPLSILAAPLEEVACKLGKHFAADSLGANSSPDGTETPEVTANSKARQERLVRELDQLLGTVARALEQKGEEATALRLRELRIQKNRSEDRDSLPQEVAETSLPIGKSAQSSSVAPVGERHSLAERPSVAERLSVGLDLPERENSTAERRGKNLTGKDRRIESDTASWLRIFCIAMALCLGLGLSVALVTGVLDQGSFARVFERLNPLTWFKGSTGGELARNALRDGVREPSLKVPALEPIESANQLEAILEDYRNARPPRLNDARPGGAGTEGKVNGAATQSGAGDQRGGVVNEAAQVGGGQSGAASSLREEHSRQDSPPSASVSAQAGQKETVNTSGPIEPSDFPRGRGGDRARDTGSRPGSGSTSRADRPLGERPGFQDFKSPKPFQTLVETEVMSVASVRGRHLDVLPAGVEVLVEAKEGYWLRIRSQKGNRGYILAQDAIEASQSR